MVSHAKNYYVPEKSETLKLYAICIYNVYSLSSTEESPHIKKTPRSYPSAQLIDQLDHPSLVDSIHTTSDLR